MEGWAVKKERKSERDVPVSVRERLVLCRRDGAMMQGDPGDPAYCAVSSSCWRGAVGNHRDLGKLDAQEVGDGASIQKGRSQLFD